MAFVVSLTIVISMFEGKESGNKEKQEEDLLSWVSSILMPQSWFSIRFGKEESKGKIYTYFLLFPAPFVSGSFLLS